MITIFDYGAGNLRSVRNTLDEIGARYVLSNNAAGLLAADKIILPGVGHYGQMLRALDALEVRAALLGRIRAGVPFLGICLGLQALFESSSEAPEMPGLGLFEGHVERFSEDARVPHMGWNRIEPAGESRLLKNLAGRPYLYFAHSYYVPRNARTAASCQYGVTFTAVLESQNVFGVQFHPEKSGAAGLQIMRNFVDLDLP